MGRKRVNPDGTRPSSTGKVRNVKADQSSWRKKLQTSRLKFDDDQKNTYLTELAKHSLKGRAAQAAGVSSSTIDNHRKNDPEFQEAEIQALAEYRDSIVEHLTTLAVEGIEVRRYNKDGDLIEERRDYPIRLIELEAKRVEPEYRDRSSVDLNTQGGGVLVAPAGQSVEDWVAEQKKLNAQRQKPE